jgi:hypothetical protein
MEIWARSYVHSRTCKVRVSLFMHTWQYGWQLRPWRQITNILHQETVWPTQRGRRRATTRSSPAPVLLRTAKGSQNSSENPPSGKRGLHRSWTPQPMDWRSSSGWSISAPATSKTSGNSCTPYTTSWTSRLMQSATPRTQCQCTPTSTLITSSHVSATLQHPLRFDLRNPLPLLLA